MVLGIRIWTEFNCLTSILTSLIVGWITPLPLDILLHSPLDKTWTRVWQLYRQQVDEWDVNITIMSHTSPAFVASSHEQSINCNCSDKNNIFIDFQDPNSARIGWKGQKSIRHNNNLDNSKPFIYNKDTFNVGLFLICHISRYSCHLMKCHLHLILYREMDWIPNDVVRSGACCINK